MWGYPLLTPPPAPLLRPPMLGSASERKMDPWGWFRIRRHHKKRVSWAIVFLCLIQVRQLHTRKVVGEAGAGLGGARRGCWLCPPVLHALHAVHPLLGVF